MESRFKVGDQVRMERDETVYPAKGTWPKFRGKTGTVVEVNRDREHPDRTEYGIEFGQVRRPSTCGSISRGRSVWFRGHELRRLPP